MDFRAYKAPGADKKQGIGTALKEAAKNLQSK